MQRWIPEQGNEACSTSAWREGTGRASTKWGDNDTNCPSGSPGGPDAALLPSCPLREGKANISDAYGIVRNGEIFLLNLHISPYERGGYSNHEPTRTRKLLLHRKEIRRLIGAVEREGLTLVPLELYFKKGVAKVALALGKGKKLHDKRETERRRDADREMARAMRSR